MMGRRGPQKTPTKVLNMRGSWRGKAREDEPEAPQGRPRCPAWLRREAKNAWARLIPQLDEMGVLGMCDRNALARYCQMYAKWRVAEEFVAAHTEGVFVVRNGDGSVKEVREYPQVAQAIRYGEQLLRLEREFGLTAAARASLAVEKANPQENRGKGGKWWAAG